MKKLIALTTGLVAGTALAAISNNVGVSSQKVKPSAWQDFKERSSISYFGEFNDATAVNPNKETADNQNFYYQAISGRYKINDTWTARADLRLETKEGVDDKYSELNPRIGIQGVVYANGNFSIFHLTRLEIASTEADRDADKYVKPKIYNAANYSLGAQSFSVGLELSKWIYDDTEEKQDNQFGTFVDLTYRYTFNDTATFQTYVELPGSVRNGQALYQTERNQAAERYLVGMDFSVAKNFMNIAQNVTIFPHLDVQPNNDKGLGDVGVGAWLQATFFQ